MKQKLAALACAVCLCAGLYVPAAAAGTYSDVPGGAWYESAVESVTEDGYMTGVDETHFAPTANVTRATVVMVLWRMEGSPEGNAPATFSDVPAGAWYAQAAAWAQGAAIAQGDEAGRFRPNAYVTRQELAVFLTRYDRYKGVTLAEGALNLYSDASKIGVWAVDGMKHAVGMGWLEGSAGLINPGGVASRAQLAVILQRMTTPANG